MFEIHIDEISDFFQDLNFHILAVILNRF